MFDLTPCFHSLETLNNFWTGGPRFSFVPGGGSYRGRPAGEEGTGRDIAHGGKVQGQERVDVEVDGEGSGHRTVIRAWSTMAHKPNPARPCSVSPVYWKQPCPLGYVLSEAAFTLQTAAWRSFNREPDGP